MLSLSHPATCRLHHAEEILFVFPKIAHWIDRALERGSNYTRDGILLGLVDGYLQLWTYGDQAALVTSLLDDECLLLCCAGRNMQEWVRYLHQIECWAKENGCKYMRIQGRRGWSRLGFSVEGKDNLGLPIMRKKIK